ncbi:MAG: imidazole glycerol phosphate synthase subunit HisH [Saprospiraceae bacterium]|nr:imidazole glycerol phosphate synthase subunit HisH [Saprospiraceae bacterium]
MSIAIINYNAGNVRSVLFAMQRLGVDAVLTDQHDVIRAADKVIFPGVGEASSTMGFLRDKGLDQLIASLQQPVLGICLGMQLLCAHSEENNTPCLGIIPQQVKLFQPEQRTKVPHMGWNQIQQLSGTLFTERPGHSTLEGGYVYFVHSYYVEQGPYTIATCDYIQPFSAAVQKDNFVATQFHPEKSGDVGELVLHNFLKD